MTNTLRDLVELCIRQTSSIYTSSHTLSQPYKKKNPPNGKPKNKIKDLDKDGIF